MSERNAVKCIGILCLTAVAISIMAFKLPPIFLLGPAALAYYLFILL